MKGILFNKIHTMVRQLYPYILECDFPIKGFITKHLPLIEEEYKEFWERPSRGGNDMRIRNKEIIYYVTTQISNIVLREFLIDPKSNFKTYLRLYMQTNNNYESTLHNHIHAPGNLCSVFYLNVPKKGGEILFSNSKLGGEVKIKPQEEKLYLFPKWLDHKPLPQLDKTPRLCFNWDYPGIIRPIVKYTKVLW